ARTTRRRRRSRPALRGDRTVVARTRRAVPATRRTAARPARRPGTEAHRDPHGQRPGVLVAARRRGLLRFGGGGPEHDPARCGAVRVIDVASPEWTAMLAPFADTVVETAAHSPDDLFMLIFTSGTSGDPKAVRCTHRKFIDPATMLATRFGLGPDDTVYVSMPLFHSNAMIAGWSIGLAA